MKPITNRHYRESLRTGTSFARKKLMPSLMHTLELGLIIYKYPIIDLPKRTWV